jgi:predicted amidohydrolase
MGSRYEYFICSLTDTQNGYTRVKHCAQARAIENECYVAIAGCVGTYQSQQYGYSVCTSGCLHPSDFAFPSNGIKAEATQIQK